MKNKSGKRLFDQAVMGGMMFVAVLALMQVVVQIELSHAGAGHQRVTTTHKITYHIKVAILILAGAGFHSINYLRESKAVATEKYNFLL